MEPPITGPKTEVLEFFILAAISFWPLAIRQNIMHKFKKLKIWQKSLQFTKKIYQLTDKFPNSELFGITSQLRRASVSIYLNIAEGSASKSDIEFRRFLIISLKSIYEVVAIIELCKELKYLKPDECIILEKELDDLGAMTNGLINKLKLSNKKANSQ